MKTTKAQFKAFKESFLAWQIKLGLTQYQPYFYHEPLDDPYADIIVNELEKICSVRMCTDLNSINLKSFQPQVHGDHECIHLAVNRLGWLGQQRCIENCDLNEESEALVRRLQHVLIGGEL